MRWTHEFIGFFLVVFSMLEFFNIEIEQRRAWMTSRKSLRRNRVELLRAHLL